MADELVDTLRMQIRETAACVSAMKIGLHEIKTSVAVLRERSDHATENCPQRVAIARNTNDVKAAHDCADKALLLAQNNRIKIAQMVVSGAAGGGLVAIAQALLTLAK